jgi:hypothetical protein
MKVRQGSCASIRSILVDQLQSWSWVRLTGSAPDPVELNTTLSPDCWGDPNAGRAEEAVRIYVALLEEDPDNTALLDLTAELLADLGFDE